MPGLAGGPGGHSLVPGCEESPSGEGGAAKFCKGFSPGEVGIPGSLQKRFQGYPLGYVGVSGGVGGVACRHVLPNPLPKAARVGRTFRQSSPPPPLVVNVSCGGG